MRYFANTANNHAHKQYWLLWMEGENKHQMQNSLQSETKTFNFFFLMPEIKKMD